VRTFASKPQQPEQMLSPQEMRKLELRVHRLKREPRGKELTQPLEVVSAELFRASIKSCESGGILNTEVAHNMENATYKEGMNTEVAHNMEIATYGERRDVQGFAFIGDLLGQSLCGWKLRS